MESKGKGSIVKSNGFVRGRRHGKPFDPEVCLESHRTGLISVKTVKVGRKYSRMATELTYLCTYCMWECHVFLGVLPRETHDLAARPPAENSSGAGFQ
jgi:hypothetical protein